MLIDREVAQEIMCVDPFAPKKRMAACAAYLLGLFGNLGYLKNKVALLDYYLFNSCSSQLTASGRFAMISDSLTEPMSLISIIPSIHALASKALWHSGGTGLA